MAKAMILRAGGRTAAVVTLDLIGVQRTILDGLRAGPLPAGLAADDILVCASHTHASYGGLAHVTGAPGIDALFLLCCGPYREDFFREVLEKIRAALFEAAGDLRPARIGVGSRALPGLCHNRGRGDGPVDDEVGVVRVTGEDGALRGVLVNLAAHPVILGADNFACSAEFPGVVERELESRFPGATALFTQGAEGDLTVSVPAGAGPDAWARVDATGRRIADHVAALLPEVPTAARVGLEARLVEVDLPRPQALADRAHALLGQRASLVFQLVIGDALFMGTPGEPCCRIGLDLKEGARALGFSHAFVVGLAEDHCGYFVHAEDYAPGRETSHEYEKRLNFPGPGMGAFLVDVHLRRLAPRPARARALF
jgi:hypothetical protein